MDKDADYCLLPAIDARSYIYEQCKLVDGDTSIIRYRSLSYQKRTTMSIKGLILKEVMLK